MNILIPDSWLREYLVTKLPPAEIARVASLHGPSFEHLSTVEGEVVYDIEVTTNRPDLMSVQGLARELAAIMPQECQLRLHPHQLPQHPSTSHLPLPKFICQTHKLHRALAIVVDGVKNQPAPEFMARRLRQIGLNPQGVVVDTTNYITHEIGHPCHAFDYDKIMALGGEIVAVQAQAGMTFTTLDGSSYQTKGGEVIFTNGSGEIIDLPAIMGTANTCIDAATTRVLLWLENLDAQVVRQASMQHAIRTSAAVLNEKAVDCELMPETLFLGAALLCQWAGGQVASELFSYPAKLVKKQSQVTLPLARLRHYLGVDLPVAKVSALLGRLGFVMAKKTSTEIQVVVPSWRHNDIHIPEDLIEEIARLYGYHLLPSSTAFSPVQIQPQENFYFAVEKRCRHFLADAGLTEVYTYSMVGAAMLSGNPKKYLSLANPLTEERVYLRQSLLPSLQETWQQAASRGRQHTQGVFELAKVYLPQLADKVSEPMHLAFLLALDYRQARAVVEHLLANFYIKINIDEQGKIYFNDDKQAAGLVTALEQQLFGWELDLATIGTKARLYPQLRLVNNQPVIIEELTFTLPKAARVGKLLAEMRAAIPQLQSVELLGIYEHNYSFRFVYQDSKQPLTRTRVTAYRQQLVAMLKQQNCLLVGEI